MKPFLKIIPLFFLSTILFGEEILEDFRNPSFYRTTHGKATMCSLPGPTPEIPAVRIQMPGMLERTIQPHTHWERYKGIRFRVRGDGSDSWGIFFFNAPNFRWNHCYYFPLKNKEWTEYRVAWNEFCGPMPWLPFNTAFSTAPSDIKSIGFGSWRITLYAMKRIEPYSFDIADLRFIENAAGTYQTGKYCIPPFRNFAEKLKGNGEIRIGCIGDSITAGLGAGKQAYAFRLGRALEKKTGRKGILSFNRGIGGSGLLDHIKCMKQDLDRNYDLVTLMIGYNDVGHILPDLYEKYLIEWLDRLAFHTRGETSVVLIPPLPARGTHWNRQDDFANIFRKVARNRGIVICDLAAEMKRNGEKKLLPLLKDHDRVHLNVSGHDVILRALTDTILKALSHAEETKP